MNYAENLYIAEVTATGETVATSDNVRGVGGRAMLFLTP